MNEYTFKCPHCGCVHNAWEYLDMDMGLLDGEFEVMCEYDDCGLNFIVEVETTVKFNAVRRTYMYARDFKVGTRFKHNRTGRVLKVIVYDGGLGEEKLFEDEEWGDLWSYVDEDMYTEL